MILHLSVRKCKFNFADLILLPQVPVECFCTSVIETCSPCVPDCMQLVYLKDICNGKYSYRSPSFLSSLSIEYEL